MNLSDAQMAAALDALYTNGASYAFVGSDGADYVIRLRIEPDDEPIADIADHGDCYGHTSEYISYDRRSERPDGFDGAARKIDADRGGYVWWQPPADIKADPEATEATYRSVRDIVEFGFYSVTVSLHETVTDSWGGDHLVVVRTASLGGVEPLTTGEYVTDIVSDLLADLFHELGDVR